MIVQVGNPACPTARAGCSSSESMLNFRLELLRQAMAERRRLKDSRARSQAIATQCGSFSRSASSEANRLRKVVVTELAGSSCRPEVGEITSGVKAALSTVHIILYIDAQKM